MTEAMPFLRKVNITFLCPPAIPSRSVFIMDQLFSTGAASSSSLEEEFFLKTVAFR